MVSQTDINYINRVVEGGLSEDSLTLNLKGKFLGDDAIPALLLCPQLEHIQNLDLILD